MRSYICWRRAHFIFIFPLALLSAIWNVMEIIKKFSNNDSYYNNDGYSVFGKFATTMPSLYPSLILIACVYSLLHWQDFLISRRISRWAWIASLLFTFAPAFFPPDWILSEYIMKNEELVTNATIKLAALYAVKILPLATTLSIAIMNGCLIVRGLIPR